MSRLRGADHAPPDALPRVHLDADRNPARQGTSGNEGPKTGQAAILNGLRVIVSEAMPPDSYMLVNEHAVADFLHKRFRGDPTPKPDELEEELATAVAMDPQTYAALVKATG